ncbi:hypothetical protein LTR43_005180 [Exophiala xenobiotica]|nr:hypothetical protein LTR14_005457 [Exophiala xenobiotica]
MNFDNVFASEKFNTAFARHEQSTGHMAEGYARASGKPGVAFVLSGPGLTNMVTAMQDALSNGTPMIVISAEVPHAPGWDGHDTVDVIGISESCTKWNVTARSPQDLPEKINKAFEVATSGRPGPVLVHVPKALDSNSTKPSRPSVALKRRAAAVETARKPAHESKQALSRVARLVNISQKPVLYVGQGMLARPEGTLILKEFADKTAIPVTTSLQGLGAFDELDPKALHMLRLHGSAYANLAIQQSDLIIALGARFDDRVTGHIAKFAPKSKAAAAENRGGIVHFDIAPKNINKVVMVNEAVQGDCSESLAELTTLVRAVDDRPEWFKQISEWKRKFPFSAYKEEVTLPTPGLIRAQEVIERLSDITNHMKDRTIISTGVGQHQMWAAQHFRWRHPRTMVTSGGLGTMGFGLLAAIGAKLAHPNSHVIDIDGDASFNMTIAELATAAQHKIGVKVLLFNNEQMGMVSDLQRLYYKGKFVHNRQGNPDFVKASRAWGVDTERCSRVADIDEKLRWLLETESPAVLEVVTEQNSPVWPVVPAGKGLHEFVTYGVGLPP